VRLSVVVPCYREAAGLAALHQRVTAAATAAVDADYEFILVNDGSPDATWERLCELAARDAHVVAVNLSRNHGHQLALSAGLSCARGERVFMLDADLQDPPELLAEMMRAMDAGADVVYGQRSRRAGETLFKRATAALFYRLLARLSDVDIPSDSGDFRLVSRRALAILREMPERQRFLRGMISWIGFRQVAVRYERQPRSSGRSSYPLRTMVRLALDAITGFSTRPLRLASLLGLLMAAVGGVGIIVTIAAWLRGGTVAGWASVMVVMLSLGGIQLIVLGIIGEYLGRLYMEAKQRPLYVIDEIRAGGARG
jgi:glycosyltransferase involved in cell wall biosynthesis